MKTTPIAVLCMTMITASSSQEAKPMKTMTAKPSASELEAKERESWEQFKHKD